MRAVLLAITLIISGCANQIQTVETSPFTNSASPSSEQTIGYMYHLIQSGTKYEPRQYERFEGTLGYSGRHKDKIYIEHIVHSKSGFAVPRPGYILKLDLVNEQTIRPIRNPHNKFLPYSLTFECIGACIKASKTLPRWMKATGLASPRKIYHSRPSKNLHLIHGDYCPPNTDCFHTYDSITGGIGTPMISFTNVSDRDEFIKAFSHLVAMEKRQLRLNP